MLIPVLPEIRHDLQLTQVQSSLILSIFSIAGAITIPFIGFISDKYSRKSVILISLILYGVGGLLSGLASIYDFFGFAGIMLGRIFQGIGSAGTAPIAMAITADLFSRQKQLKILGYMEASNSFGKVISPIIGACIALIMWQYVFFTFPIACTILFLLFFFFVKTENKPEESLQFRRYLVRLQSVIKENKLYLLTSYSAGALCLFLLFGLLFYASDVFENMFETHGFLNGLLLSFPLLFLTAASFITGSIVGRYTHYVKRIISFNFLLLTILSASFLIHSSLWWTIVVLSLISTSIGIILPCINAIITNAADYQARGFVTALYGSVRFIGIASGPLVFGYFMDIAITYIFVLSSIFCLIQAMLCHSFLHKNPNAAPWDFVLNWISMFRITFHKKRQRG
jgi:ACDE family multidrug resistance protein